MELTANPEERAFLEQRLAEVSRAAGSRTVRPSSRRSGETRALGVRAAPSGNGGSTWLMDTWA